MTLECPELAAKFQYDVCGGVGPVKIGFPMQLLVARTKQSMDWSLLRILDSESPWKTCGGLARFRTAGLSFR